MRKNRLKASILLLFLAAGMLTIQAQQGFGTNNPDASAVIDMTSATKGVLFPRVALKSTTEKDPIVSPTDYMVVFNINTEGDVTPGLYYWKTSAWVRLLSSAGSVGINTNTPNGCAVLDVSSATQGILPPRMTSAQIAAIANPADGLMVYNTTLGCMAYYSKGTFDCIYTPPLACGGNMTVTHESANGAPENVTLTYGTVLYNGKCWITKNLGAVYQAGSFTDGGDDKVGWYWQFNRKQGFKKTGSTTRIPAIAWDATEDPALMGWIKANDPCTLLIGLDWRIPTDSEWQAADNWTFVDDAFNSLLRLHAAGLMIYNSGAFGEQGGRGLYWSSSSGKYMNIQNNELHVNGAFNNYGFPLRCLRD